MSLEKVRILQSVEIHGLEQEDAPYVVIACHQEQILEDGQIISSRPHRTSYDPTQPSDNQMVMAVMAEVSEGLNEAGMRAIALVAELSQEVATQQEHVRQRDAMLITAQSQIEAEQATNAALSGEVVALRKELEDLRKAAKDAERVITEG